MKRILSSLGVVLLLSSPALAAGEDVSKSPPVGEYQAVSKLVKLPDFLPGMGQLFVDRKTLPAGPFPDYDHDGKLVSTERKRSQEKRNAGVSAQLWCPQAPCRRGFTECILKCENEESGALRDSNTQVQLTN
ncbi:hypothetical protein [Aestuariivirga sp.]|uniref:hypothetical protein n=1 Tax=Aestuariivirga sp. TaxID=2650926 RepID=UPI003919542C